MTENERDEGRFEGEIRARMANHETRINRLEGAILFVLISAAAIGLRSLGIL